MNDRDRNIKQVKTFFDQPDRYLKNSYGIRLRTEIISQLLGDLDKVSILDIGCGNGGVSLPFLPKIRELTLMDVSENMLSRARKNIPESLKHRTVILRSDFLTFSPFQPFDIVLCVGVLAHVPSVEQAVQKLAMLTRSGGYCIIQITDHGQLLARINRLANSLHSLLVPTYRYGTNPTTFRQLVQLAESFGLIPVDQVQYSLLFPGFGALSDTFLYNYQKQVLQNARLSRWGTERIILFEKEDVV